MTQLIAYAGKSSFAARGRATRGGVYHAKATAIMHFWNAGLDTVEIGQRIKMSEAAVANALAQIRDRDRDGSK